jgi:hypothetical protein
MKSQQYPFLTKIGLSVAGLLTLYILDFFFIDILFTIHSYLYKNYGFSIDCLCFGEASTNSKSFKTIGYKLDNTSLSNVISLFIIGALVEESICRHFLAANRYSIYLSLVFGISLVLKILLDWHRITILILPSVFLLISHFYNITYKPIPHIQKHTVIYVLISSYLFSVLHNFNHFENPTTVEFLNVFNTFPQLLGGIYLATLHLKFGFGWCVAFHLLHNAVLFILR